MRITSKKGFPSRLLLLAAALAPLGAARARADEIVFKNGDRLTGTVVRAEGGKLVLKTEAAGKVKVPIDKVKTLRTDAPVELHLRDGTVLRRPLAPAEGEGVFALGGEGPVAPQTFRLADVKSINPPPARTKWTGRLAAGLAVTRGDSDAEQSSATLDLERRGADDRITLAGAYLFGRQEDPDTGERETTIDTWYASAKYDYFFTERGYLYANARAERDRIAELDLRFTPGVGAGRQWAEGSRLKLSTEAGLSWLYEDYEHAPDDAEKERLAARVAYHVEAKLDERVTLAHTLEWLPSLEDDGDHFVTGRASLRVALSEAIFLELAASATHDSTPAEDAEETNVRYLLGAGVKF